MVLRLGARAPRALLLLLVLAAAVLGLPALTPPAAAADPVLSQGKPVTASSTENAAFPAAAAVDGNPGTRWSSAAADPQWIQVDLGATATVTQVALQWETAFARSFQVQTAAAATGPYTTVFSTTTGTGGTQTIPVTGTGRYVRVLGTARATGFGYSLFELAVRTTGGGTTTPPAGTETLLSYDKPATASTSQNDGQCSNCLPAKALDFDPASRWATSAWTDPGWIAVDLGATAHVTRVVLQWDPAFATAYQIQVSPDGTNWTPIFSTTTGRGFKETLTVDGTGRFVRMFGTARATTFGYSLWEFQVYGTGGSPVAPPATPPDVTFPATRLVFDYEFNDPAGSTPSTARWTAETGSGQNNELQFYTANRNATMDGAGNLAIEARREVTAGSACPGGPCQYTSGRINTAGKFAFTYGHVEARIKVSGTQGLWPAFWLLGANFPSVGWPASGEIDVMEHVGRLPNQVFSTLHAPAYNGGNGDGLPFTGTGDFAAGFHTYGMDWDAAHMTFSVDGSAFFTLTKAQVEASRGPWVFDHPFFVILNNAVGGDFPGAPDASTVMPQRMLVDYVRVFQ
jgi:hypothetical protein